MQAGIKLQKQIILIFGIFSQSIKDIETLRSISLITLFVIFIACQVFGEIPEQHSKELPILKQQQQQIIIL